MLDLLVACPPPPMAATKTLAQKLCPRLQTIFATEPGKWTWDVIGLPACV
jgi:hypothetical protein